MTPGPIAGALVAVVVFVLMLAPPGYWLLLRLSGTPPRARDLALALALGFSTLLPLLWLERIVGVPVLVLPAVALSVLALRREWREWLSVPVGPLFVAIPLLLALLAAWIDGGDVRWVDGGASIRMGFEVSDRAFYSLVAQEVLRDPTPALQNPVFAGVTFAYGYFPALCGLLLHLYGGLDLLSVFEVQLPVVSFAFIGLAVDRLLLEWGITSRVARVLTPVLCVLGGDLSFLFPPQGVLGGERSAHFIGFCSFASESLYYNPWMLALPVVLAALVLAGRWLREGGRGTLVLAAACLAGLWQTKVFACLPLLLGALAAGALLRNRRLCVLAVLSCLLVVPWAALSLAGGDRSQPPLRLEPLYPVGLSLSVHPSWAGLAALCAPGRSPLVRAPAAVVATLLVLFCGLGVRIVGAGALARRARADATGLFAWIALTAVTALALGFLLVGAPVALDGAQFLILPQLLLWTLTGPWLAGWLRGGPVRSAAALALLAASLASPLVYVARKAWPEHLTRPGSIDRRRITLTPDAVAAARWLARQRDPARANLVADWRGRPGDGGLSPLYLAVIADKRLTAYAETFAVSEQVADRRRRQLVELYTTDDGARGEALLDALGADWVWVDAARPLRFSSPRLVLRAQGGEVQVLEFRRASAAPP